MWRIKNQPKAGSAELWLGSLYEAPDTMLGLMLLFACAVHTMAELKLSGNHLKGSRPVLSFDAAFDEQPHLQLMKEMFTHAFATPRRHPKSKPFHDHVISFHFLDNRLWLRNYQVKHMPMSLHKTTWCVT